MYRKILLSLVAALLVIPGAFAQIEGFPSPTVGDVKPLVLAVSIIGMIAAVYIIISPGRLPSGEISVGKSFKSFLVIGAILISIAEILLSVEAFGLLNPLPLPVVHDTTMAISLVFIALALREISKQKQKTVSEAV